MHNKTFAAEIAHAVSSRKRIEIISRAKQLGVKVMLVNDRGDISLTTLQVTNGKAKVAVET